MYHKKKVFTSIVQFPCFSLTFQSAYFFSVILFFHSPVRWLCSSGFHLRRYHLCFLHTILCNPPQYIIFQMLRAPTILSSGLLDLSFKLFSLSPGYFQLNIPQELHAQHLQDYIYPPSKLLPPNFFLFSLMTPCLSQKKNMEAVQNSLCLTSLIQL